MRFDHLGIVVASLAEGRLHFGNFLRVNEWTEQFSDPINQVLVQFGRDASGVCYELIAPLGEHSPVRATLTKADRILNHMAYRVTDLESEEERLRGCGCIPAGRANPAVAYGGKRIQFFMTPLRLLIELIEAPDHEHVFCASAFGGARDGAEPRKG